MPVIRYRTGDKVRLKRDACLCGRRYVRLEGGVIGRIDDALIVRGINVFPSALENIVRRFPGVGEFSADVFSHNELDEMKVRIEVESGNRDELVRSVADEIRSNLGLRVAVEPVAPGILPRFDLTTRRITDHRNVAH